MTSFAEAKDRFIRVKDAIAVERAGILELYNQPVDRTSLAFKQEIRDLQQEETRYDQEFREQQAILQSRGGKSREQTLQEFVLLFFYVGFVMVSIALAVYTAIQNGNPMNAAKVIGIMTFIGLLVTGLIIRYA